MQPIQVKMNLKGTVWEKGYGQVSRMVMTDRTLHATAKALYAYLCSYAGSDISEDRYAWPSVKTIMEDLGIKSEDTFHKYKKQLVDAGYITIDQERETDGIFKRNIYVIEVIRKEPTPKKLDTVNRHLKKRSPIKSVPDKIGVNNISSFKNNHLKNKNIYNAPLPDYIKNQNISKDKVSQLTDEQQRETERLLKELGEM